MRMTCVFSWRGRGSDPPSGEPGEPTTTRSPELSRRPGDTRPNFLREGGEAHKVGCQMYYGIISPCIFSGCLFLSVKSLNGIKRQISNDMFLAAWASVEAMCYVLPINLSPCGIQMNSIDMLVCHHSLGRSVTWLSTYIAIS